MLQLGALLLAVALSAFACGGSGKVGPTKARAGTSPPADHGTGDAAKAGAEGIRAVVHANMAAMRACYREGLARNPRLSGRVAASFTIGKDGTVSAVADVHDTPASSEFSMTDLRAEREHPRFSDRQVVECIMHEFSKLRFAPQDRGPVTAIYPLTFRPPE